MEAEKRVVIASSSQRKRERRRIRRRIRRNEKRVIAPSSLPKDVVEEIFLRLPVKALIRLKSLSRQWRSTIESRSFTERHLKIAERSRMDHPKVMVVSAEDPLKGIVPGAGIPRPDTNIGFRTFCLESASLVSFTLINFPIGFSYWTHVSESCDGLFCIHSAMTQSMYVVNPATRWLRQLPPARFQILMHKFGPTDTDWGEMNSVFHLAFVKATDYKLVWLYNSDKYNADDSSPNEGVTKCEVFDFRANAWRYLACNPSYRIFHDQKPAYANGSVYWFTEPYDGRIEVVAFDIQAETFRLLPKIIPAIAGSDPHHIDMCALDNRLCMSRREHDTMIQDIWRLKPSEDTWEKILTIDLLSCSSSRTEIRDMFNWSAKDLVEPSTPVAICKNKKILLSHRYSRGFYYWTHVSESCDGLFCIHSAVTQSIYVVNPAIRWLRQLPPARFQILMRKFGPTDTDWGEMNSVFHLAFVKATDYKLVWLYNSDKYNADDSSPNEGVTKCEVFDFRANAWRYLACTPSYRIFHDQKPAYANGSVYWFTEPYDARIQVVAFDIQAETFRLLPKINPAIAGSDPRHIDMCTLDDSLCMSRREHDTVIQYIWRLEPSEDMGKDFDHRFAFLFFFPDCVSRWI
ncbi:unnamed protein product [Thlaspi arvense]|uniref:F-box domain-containing protein n=1 Tax=Thlaspi arvense TaxID=13288 RepID=A0AAU9RD77_THLAR|nr:unnamed protein product [Thlaspi arvense]